MNLRKVILFYLFCLFNICILFVLSDYKTGFGGKFGVQTDRVDKSAVGWEHHEKVEKHESQTGMLCAFRFFQAFLFVFYGPFLFDDQITKLASGASLVFRQTELTSLPWGGSTLRRFKSTRPRRVG